MTSIASACRPRTADARRLRWRLLGAPLVSFALWGVIITIARMVLS